MQLRTPRSIGELVSDAVALLRRRLAVLVAVSLPFCAAELLMREGSAFAQERLRATLGKDVSLEGAVAALPLFGATLGLFLASLLVSQLLEAAVIRAAERDFWGRAPRIADAFAAVADRGAALVLTTLLFFAILAVVPLLPAPLLAVAALLQSPIAIGISAVAWGIFAVCAFIVLYLRFALYPQLVVLEGLAGPSALRRSRALMAGRGLPFLERPTVRLGLLLLVAFAVLIGLQSLFTVPRYLVGLTQGADGGGLPALASMPLWFIVPFGLLEVGLSAVIFPFAFVVTTLFYFDLRVRFEGFDVAESPTPPA
jgi:hypothetical protein